MEWGLIGSGSIESKRRSRHLELGAMVRHFNEQAVPGVAGLHFVKQVLWPLLGLKLAGQTGRDNIPVCNAVEALACYLGYKSNGWSADERLRGRSKLTSIDEPTYRRLQRGYVTQPMRMSTGEALRNLGLVNSENTRFSSFSINEAGEQLLQRFDFEGRLLTTLKDWLEGTKIVPSRGKLVELLSPLNPAPPQARNYLRQMLNRHSRRKAILDWMDAFLDEKETQCDWQYQPSYVEDDHWRDLEGGARFFLMRDAALEVLDALERHIKGLSDQKYTLGEFIEEPVKQALDSLNKKAEDFLKLANEGVDDIEPAREFARHCRESAPEVLHHLVERDGRVLRLQGNDILLGAASGAPPNPEEIASSEGDDWPPGISERVPRMYDLAQDLRGKWKSQHE